MSFSRLACVLSFALAVSACSDPNRVRLFHTEPIAPGLDEAKVIALDYLGPTVVATGVNFGVYSEHATRIDILLFEDPEATRPTRQFPMVRFGDVWNLYVEGIGAGWHYGYVAWGPNWPEHPDWFPGAIDGFLADVDADGNRFNPNKLLLDPFAKSVHRDHDWSRGSVASGPKRTDSTWAAAAKSVVWAPTYQWSANETTWRQNRQDPNFVDHRFSDLVIYETHLKGTTASPASGVTHPGTYLGFAENVDYLADLGITAVELMPVHEKPLDGTYWGYMTLSFFAPEHTYAFETKPTHIIAEFKEMVDTLHQNGIEVYVDVVFNHTGEGGLWREQIQIDDVNLNPFTPDDLVNYDPKEVAGIYSFRGLDNAAYYALSSDNQTYWNNTGVGNEMRTNHVPMRRLILESLRFYVEELHVDGFRFDLAPILGEVDRDYNNWDDPENTVLQDIIDDPIMQQYNTRIIAEPWSAGGNYGVKIGAFPAASGDAGVNGMAWYEWNAYYRDWWRSFMNDDAWTLSSLNGPADGGFTLTGSFDLYNWNARRPYHSVNFLTVHDGFPMYDLFSYDIKQNSCGPLNPVCCDQPLSAFCDRDSGENNNRSRNWTGDEPMKRQLMRNLFVALMVSHGTPMLLGGDEWMRTQLGNNNAYSTGADNEFNWFDWGSWQANDEKHRMHDFVRNVIRFRKEHRYAFAPAAYGAGAPYAWKSAANTEPPDWNSRHLMIHYYDASVGPELVILINLERVPVDFTLPQAVTWQRLIDTQQYFDSPAFFTMTGQDVRMTGNISLDAPETVGTPTYSVPGSSIVVLQAAP